MTVSELLAQAVCRQELEMRIQDAAVETTSLQQAMVCHVFSDLLAGCVRQLGVSHALVASLRANMHVHFVFFAVSGARLAFTNILACPFLFACNVFGL